MLAVPVVVGRSLAGLGLALFAAAVAPGAAAASATAVMNAAHLDLELIALVTIPLTFVTTWSMTADLITRARLG